MTRYAYSQRGNAKVVDGTEVTVRRTVSSTLSARHPLKVKRDRSLDRSRLEGIAAELNLLFAYRIEAATCFAQMGGTNALVLHLGQSIGLRLSVRIDKESGDFVLHEVNDVAPTILITPSVERLVDQIVSVTSVTHNHLMPRTIDQAVDVLIGQSIADVESRLLMRTMRYFRGNGPQVAFALGVDEAELVSLMQRHLVDAKVFRSVPEDRL